MSKRRYLIIIALLFISYVAFVWQHLFTGHVLYGLISIKIYYAAGLCLFLGTTFFNYLYERFHGSKHLPTIIYILLFFTGAPFLYKLVLFLMMSN